MKRLVCLVLAVGLITTGLVSCGKKAKDGRMTVESNTCNFKFECPDTWVISETDGMLSAYNPDDISKANVTAFSFSHGLDVPPAPSDYWVTYRSRLADTFGDIVQHEAKEIELGGQKVMHTDYTVTIGGESFDCETILAIYDSDVFTLTLTQGAKENYDSENYNDHSDEFAEIIKTFRITY